MARPRTVVAGGVSVLLGAGAAALIAREVLRRQAAAARRAIGKPLGEQAPRADRTWKRKAFDNAPLQLAVLGDSIAAGLGAERRKDTLGARLAIRLARRARQPVRLWTVAEVGAETSDLDTQIDRLPEERRLDVAVIVVGGNDVIHSVPVSRSIGSLESAVRRLRARGTGVVVGTCPDLGVLRPVPQPLRTILSRLSRRLAASQALAATRAGAWAVSLRDAVGASFRADPDGMFSIDRFHPSAVGYRRTAKALLPALLGSLARNSSTHESDFRDGRRDNGYHVAR